MCQKAEDSAVLAKKKSTATDSSSGKSSSSTVSITENKKKEEDVSKIYSWIEPPKSEPPLQMKDHFSSLLFGGSLANTLLEHALLIAPVMVLYGVDNDDILNVAGSMPFSELVTFFWVSAVVRRVYNAYLEAVYFTCPQYRIQPPKEHHLKKTPKDLCGRDRKQLELLNFHDKCTMISQFALNVGMYYALPGFYPAQEPNEDLQQSYAERFGRLLLNHYIMSFGMYWAHRSLHVIPYLWDHIHSIHHYAKHPLSRNTYEDHWADNFGNAIVGHLFAQILVPLDRPTFWFSRLFRILESLEKHSGVSCRYNLAHSAQQWLPFAQMPHHHDWHHEGFKGSNYTFSSLGGLWDCVFGTRKSGRYTSNDYAGATKRDMAKVNEKKDLPAWFSPLYPLVGLSMAVAYKLQP